MTTFKSFNFRAISSAWFSCMFMNAGFMSGFAESSPSKPVGFHTDCAALNEIALKYREICERDIYLFPKLPKFLPTVGKIKDMLLQPRCYRTSELMNCYRTYVSNIDPCVSRSEEKATKVGLDIENILKKSYENQFTSDCDGTADFIHLFTHQKHDIDCIRKDGASNLKQCIKKNLEGSQIYENYESMTMNSSNITEYLNYLNEALKNPDFELEKCRIAFNIGNCMVDELVCPSRMEENWVRQSVLNAVQNSMTCMKYTQSELDPSSALKVQNSFTYP